MVLLHPCLRREAAGTGARPQRTRPKKAAANRTTVCISALLLRRLLGTATKFLPEPIQPIPCDLWGFQVLLSMKYLSPQDVTMTRQHNAFSQLLRTVLVHGSKRRSLIVLVDPVRKLCQRNTAWPEPHQRMQAVYRRRGCQSRRRNVSPRTAWAWRALNLYRHRLARKY